ncbi:AAA family ATPase [Desulfococcaceae bacterium HSG8]|nr:AAA family ATPase [Desulfococcaceae bacterium HSG8]
MEVEGLWNKYNIRWEPDPEVNILVGRNGSGKSTLLNLLNQALTDGDFFERTDCQRLKITFDNDKFNEYFFVEGKAERIVKKILSTNDLISVIYISTFDMSVRNKEIENFSEDIRTPLDIELNELINTFSRYQFSKQRNESIDIFFDIINEFFEHTEKIVKSDDNKYLFFLQDNIKLLPYQLSSGEKQIIIILLHVLLQILYRSHQPCILLMDEPEISLHIEWQEPFIENVRRLNKNTQIIMATHSPGMVMEGWLDKITEMETIRKKR